MTHDISPARGFNVILTRLHGIGPVRLSFRICWVRVAERDRVMAYTVFSCRLIFPPDSKLILRETRRRILGILSVENRNRVESAKMPWNQLPDLFCG